MMSNNKKSESSGRKALKRSGPEQVEEFMKNLEHPLKTEIEEVRKIILSANPQLREHIKWNAPSFQYQEEDRVTFNLRGKDFFILVFHCGAKVKERAGKEPLLEDTTGLLEWAAVDRGIIKLKNMEDVVTKKEKIIEVINKWLEVS